MKFRSDELENYSLYLWLRNDFREIYKFIIKDAYRDLSFEQALQHFSDRDHILKETQDFIREIKLRLTKFVDIGKLSETEQEQFSDTAIAFIKRTTQSVSDNKKKALKSSQYFEA